MLYLLLKFNNLVNLWTKIFNFVLKPFILLNKKYKVYSDYIYLRNCGVDTQLGYVTLIGKPIIQKHENSTIKIGKGVTLISDCKGNPSGISHPVILATLSKNAEIILNDNCGLSGATICSKKSISIGLYVGLGANVSIFDNDFHSIDPYLRIYSNEDIKYSPIKLDDYSWVGANSIILKGSNIGKGSILGAGSVLTSEIPELSIFAGNPAKFVKKINIDNETYSFLFMPSKE